jgi:hypothetical protein
MVLLVGAVLLPVALAALLGEVVVLLVVVLRIVLGAWIRLR